MNTFCPDELEDCDLVPCAGCHKLFHPTFLGEHLHCETCDCAQESATEN